MTRSDPRAEHGGVAVLVAVLMAALVGLGAIVIDVGALYAERRQLQNGADAAALAAAQRCASGDCGDLQGLTSDLASANANDRAATVERIEVADSAVTVSTRTLTADGGGALRHHLAPVLGIEQSEVRADSTAGWGGPSGGTAMLPFVLSWCAFSAQTGGGIPQDAVEQTITYHEDSTAHCRGPSGKDIPGGFGWLRTDDGECSATSSLLDAQTPGKTGVSVPDTCAAEDFRALRGATVLLPLFDQAGGTGNSGWYHVHGYAAFRITGYRFACPSAYRWNDGSTACGSSSDRFVKGYFTQFVSPSDAFRLGGPDLGGRIVALTR